jgi:phospholipase/carboxylesterase
MKRALHRGALDQFFNFQRVLMPSHDRLIVFLHGIGASGAQLTPLANSWKTELPNSRFVAPDAPFHHPYGRQWFRVDGNPLDPRRIGAAREGFDKLVIEVIEKEGFSNALERTAFVGVSQGAIMALDAVASGRWQVGAVVSFAGLLAPQPISSKSKHTRILLVHGAADNRIPSMASTFAAAQFGTAGFEVELEIEPGVGHTISSLGAQRALTFLKKVMN